jgi:beta-galactosidase
MLVMFAAAPAAAQPRETSSFDSGWRFAKGDVAGAETIAFDDAGWTGIDLPHDWVIAGPFDEHAAATGSGAFLPSGIAWYRKHFTLPETILGKRVFIEFDGVMERSGVWVNGVHVGYRPNGYAGFRYEITDQVKPGTVNVMAVRADTSMQPASRWYAGGGIYRHVRLIVTGDVHVDTDGTYVTTPKIEVASAEVAVRSSVINQSAAEIRAHLEVDLLGPDGKKLAGASASPCPPAARSTCRRRRRLPTPAAGTSPTPRSTPQSFASSPTMARCSTRTASVSACARRGSRRQAVSGSTAAI